MSPGGSAIPPDLALMIDLNSIPFFAETRDEEKTKKPF